MARRIAFSGTFHGVDHERIAANEEIFRPVQGAIILTEQNVPQSFAPIDFGWGGEVHATFTVTASLSEKSRVGIVVNGKLYEGDNEAADPSQLEDDKWDDLVVPKGGQTVPLTMTLFNDGAFGGGGDTATLSLTFTNTLVEDEEDEPIPPAAPVRLRRFRHIRTRLQDVMRLNR
jgi:hypothetical protein